MIWVMLTKNSRTKERAPNGNSRERILAVALQEFAAKGLGASRVDRIAARAKTSKRMLYYYFPGKQALYRAVLELAYAGIRAAESNLDVDHMNPVEALETLVGLSFDYHCKHESFVRLVMNENIELARHVPPGQAIENRPILITLGKILKRGEKARKFRSGIDPKQLHLTISGLNFGYVSNRHTFSLLFELDMRSETARAQRREIVIDTVLRWCKRLK
jgi:AcrR family transcriptional regulator